MNYFEKIHGQVEEAFALCQKAREKGLDPEDTVAIPLAKNMAERVEGLISVLEKAKKDEQILVVSYGSGSGCDAFLMTMLKNGKPLPVDTREPAYLQYSEYLEHSGALPA